jgi:hypothetical protein
VGRTRRWGRRARVGHHCRGPDDAGEQQANAGGCRTRCGDNADCGASRRSSFANITSRNSFVVTSGFDHTSAHFFRQRCDNSPDRPAFNSLQAARHNSDGDDARSRSRTDANDNRVPSRFGDHGRYLEWVLQLADAGGKQHEHECLCERDAERCGPRSDACCQQPFCLSNGFPL